MFLFALVGCAVCDIDDPGREYLGAAYVADPLGEGVAPDSDPLVRDDAFDCVTFVEASLAGGDVQKLNKIRYKGGVVDLSFTGFIMPRVRFNNPSDAIYKVGCISTKSRNYQFFFFEGDFGRGHLMIDVEKNCTNIGYFVQ